MECNKPTNVKNCTCTYSGCDKKGLCCVCIQYHLGRHELPGCCFPPEFEENYDRSFEAFVRAWDLRLTG